MGKFQFKNKVIYILSPEAWGTMRFSKHHYALELSAAGNKVFFIEPPDLSLSGINIKKSNENEGLHIVSYKPVFRAKRFLPDSLFRILLRLQVKLLKSKIGINPDVVFCFDPFRFSNLKWFGAGVNIFFMADLFSTQDFPEEAATADFCLGLSESRLKILRQGPRPAFFINHGLSHFYVEKAKTKLANLEKQVRSTEKRITAGYIGNLMMAALDRKTMRDIIRENTDIDFVFWGQYEKSGQLVAFQSDEVIEFIGFLKEQANVTLRGPVHPEKLSEEIAISDFFWVCWKLGVNRVWDGSNPHKILEYLSSGKPVVAHYVDAYKDSDLIDMMSGENNDDYPRKFHSVIERIKETETIEPQQKRLQFAIENSYSKQLEKIEDIINSL